MGWTTMVEDLDTQVHCSSGFSGVASWCIQDILGAAAVDVEKVPKVPVVIIQLAGAWRFLLWGGLAKVLWRAWIDESTLAIKLSNRGASIGFRFRNSNKGTDRCELYIFSIWVPRPPIDPSMLSSNAESSSGEGNLRPMP